MVFNKTNVKIIKNNKIIIQVAVLPNQNTIQANSVGVLPLHNALSKKAQTTYTFPNLTNESLLSVGQICDDDCEVVFDKTNVKIIKNNNNIMQGRRSPYDKLFDIYLTPAKQVENTKSTIYHKMNYIIRKDKSKTDLARYLHACDLSPCLSTFIKAI